MGLYEVYEVCCILLASHNWIHKIHSWLFGFFIVSLYSAGVEPQWTFTGELTQLTLTTQGRPPPAALAELTSVKQSANSATSSNPTPNAMQSMQHAKRECIPLWIHIVGTQFLVKIGPKTESSFQSGFDPSSKSSKLVCLLRRQSCKNVPGCVDTWIVLQSLAVDECVWCLLGGLPVQDVSIHVLHRSAWRPDYAAWGFDFRVLVMSLVHAVTTNKTWRELLCYCSF